MTRQTQETIILKTMARKTHDDLTEEILKKLKKNNSQAILPLWSNISSEMVSKYAYIVESNAIQLGFPLRRCESSWAANLLLSETHKFRCNRARNKAIVFGNPTVIDHDQRTRPKIIFEEYLEGFEGSGWGEFGRNRYDNGYDSHDDDYDSYADPTPSTTGRNTSSSAAIRYGFSNKGKRRQNVDTREGYSDEEQGLTETKRCR
ncbi:uncharacterized protein EV154DRAFT_484235 [Mucor mucedo]|uniref:uncharacterized protein n=1 Tax=Mucor mucedo TaxID=29922 RepID=UPI00221FA0D5|nr:uncharacterized protein EV154DRAFT_484235 [Mucor mucedo]KAI7888270.1 hypothetical protein EV154DRAFT_484235 [Mucor mucedo]